MVQRGQRQCVMRVVGRHHGDDVRTVLPGRLGLDQHHPVAVAAVGRNPQLDPRPPGPLGMRRQCGGHQLVPIIEASRGAMHRPDEAARTTADHRQPQPPAEHLDHRVAVHGGHLSSSIVPSKYRWASSHAPVPAPDPTTRPRRSSAQHVNAAVQPGNARLVGGVGVGGPLQGDVLGGTRLELERIGRDGPLPQPAGEELAAGHRGEDLGPGAAEGAVARRCTRRRPGSRRSTTGRAPSRWPASTRPRRPGRRGSRACPARSRRRSHPTCVASSSWRPPGAADSSVITSTRPGCNGRPSG